MSAAPDYRRFLDGKAVRCDAVGFEADRLSDHLFSFQRDVVAFLLRVGAERQAQRQRADAVAGGGA